MKRKGRIQIGEYVKGYYSRIDFYGWVAARPYGQSTLIELDYTKSEKGYGHDGNGQVDPAYVSVTGNREAYFWVQQIRRHERFPNMTHPRHSYSVSKTRKQDGIRVGNVWITVEKSKKK